MEEKTISFGKSNALRGVITLSGKPQSSHLPFIIFLNAGLIHRIGPNRLYVTLARKLAEIGFNSLRFDFSGIGESQNNELYDSVRHKRIDEIKSALQILKTNYNNEDFILMGICSGADFAYYASKTLESIRGLILINGSFLETEQYTQIDEIVNNSIKTRYYKKKLFNIKNWVKLLSGKSKKLSYKKLTSIVFRSQVSTKNHQEMKLNRWEELIQKEIKILLIYSEGSDALDVYNLSHKRDVAKYKNWISTVLLIDTDHVFTPVHSQNVLISKISKWLESLITVEHESSK